MLRYVENERNEFTDETVEGALKRSGGHCEKCGEKLAKGNRGRKGEGCWEAHHKDGKPENCQILCWPCHEKTMSKSPIEQLRELIEGKKSKPTRIMIRKNLNIK